MSTWLDSAVGASLGSPLAATEACKFASFPSLRERGKLCKLTNFRFARRGTVVVESAEGRHDCPSKLQSRLSRDVNQYGDSSLAGRNSGGQRRLGEVVDQALLRRCPVCRARRKRRCRDLPGHPYRWYDGERIHLARFWPADLEDRDQARARAGRAAQLLAAPNAEPRPRPRPPRPARPAPAGAALRETLDTRLREVLRSLDLDTPPEVVQGALERAGVHLSREAVTAWLDALRERRRHE